jgi:hypothetical protein
MASLKTLNWHIYTQNRVFDVFWGIINKKFALLINRNDSTLANAEVYNSSNIAFCL